MRELAWMVCAIVAAGCSSGGFNDTPPSQQPAADASTDQAVGTDAAATCPKGTGDCDESSANGCETDTQSSLAHCGACGNACASGEHGTAVCETGSCKLACAMGYLDCDGKAANGCEVHALTDPANCATCGNVCPGKPNAEAVCNTGACSFKCAQNFADCDSVAANGCEIDLSADITNCGSCGSVCGARANSHAVCQMACSWSCNGGWGDCDGNKDNGCETELAANLEHCGACGNACSSAHGEASCGAGACAIVCEPSWLDCDGSSANGCEVDSQTDAEHCGWCGHSCLGATCTEGLCEPKNLGTSNLMVTSFTSWSGQLYWATYHEGLGSGYVHRMPAAGAAVVQMATFGGNPKTVRVDGTGIYYLLEAGTAHRVPLSGGAAVLVGQTEAGARFLLLDGVDMYWVAGSPTTRIFRTQKTGSASSPIATLDSGGVGELRDDANNLYFTDVAFSRVYSVGKAGPTVTLIAENQDAARGLVVDDQNLYWANFLANNIMKKPKVGGSPAALVSNTDAPRYLETDGTDLYWHSTDGIHKVPKTGGEPKRLSAGATGDSYLLIDDKYVYWVANVTTGYVTFFRVAK